MSTTTSPTPAIRDFAAAVRAALSDLPADEVDDLTDGLESDLTEQAEDTNAPGFTPADADAAGYADELRAAAGLPDRGKSRSHSMPTATRLRFWASAQWSRFTQSARSTVFGSHALDFFISLRPFWWILRGWAVYKVISALLGSNGVADALPSNGFDWILLLAFVGVSVQWGRGHWLPWSWLPPFKTVVSVCSIITLPFLLMLVTPVSASADPYVEDYLPQGLLLDGHEVSNVFAYDADGQLLTGVQLFDQEGRPLTTVGDPNGTPWTTSYDTNGVETILIPSLDVPGRTGWNVFPLKKVDPVNFDSQPDGEPDLSTATAVVPPFAQVQPLAGPKPSPVATPTPTASPTSTPSPAPSATLAPSTTPKPKPGGDK